MNDASEGHSISPWRGAHYADGRFYNPGAPRQRLSSFLRWITKRDQGKWGIWKETHRGPAPPQRVEGTTLRATFVNHATFLLQTAGLNLLTDPVWSERVSPVSFAGPKRRRSPGVRMEDLPRIDAILISHNHYDHFDTDTLTRLLKRDRPAVFCPLGLGAALKKLGFANICELDWWQHAAWNGLVMHCVPAQHFSARGPFDRNKTLWCGWMLEADGGSVYFAGDTGFGGLFEEIAASFPCIRLSLLPIGAFKPHWFMGPIHMTPSQALYAHRILGSAHSIATHFGTFPLADDGEREPLEGLERAMRQDPPVHPFLVLREGEDYEIPALPRPLSEEARTSVV